MPSTEEGDGGPHGEPEAGLDGATVLVLGASTLLATEVAHDAVDRGAQRVLICGDPAPDLSLLGVEARERTTLVGPWPDDEAGRDALLGEHRPDVVIHLGRHPDPDGPDDPDEETWLLRAARRHGARLVLWGADATSIVAVLGARGRAPHDPDLSDASVRAALANERTNGAHLRRLAREQKAKLQRPAVRVALALDRRGRRLLDALELRRRRARRRIGRAELVALAVPGRRELSHRRGELEAVLHQLAESPPGDARVSVVTVVDGRAQAAHLDRSQAALASAVEHIVVCWGDPPPRPVDLPDSLGADVVVLRDDWPSATAAVAAGIERASGDVVCLRAATSEPLQHDFLDRMTAALDAGVVAAGPLLVHPARSLSSATPHDLLVREAGLDVVVTDVGVPEVRAREAGQHVRPSRPPAEVAALSRACIVVDRTAFLEAGGLAPIADLDAAVVDLCGRLRAGGGRVVTVPGAVVADHRPVRSPRALTRPVDPAGAGWRAVVDRQGPTLIKLASGDRVTEHLRIAVTVAAPSMRVAARWGDWHLAQGLARALRRQGHSVHLQTLDRADDPVGRSCDVHVALRGQAPVSATPGQAHVIWIISHPESIDVEECDRADLVLVASEHFARDLRRRTSTPVEVLLQATDHRRFSPRQPDPTHGHAVAVVATTRHVFRPSVEYALAGGLRPAIYGSGWEEYVDPALVVAEHVPNTELATVYSSVGVLLNDHWDTMRAWGFVSNRIFDALACATPLVSDRLPEIADLFGDAVATYDDAEGLVRAVEAALDDPVAARARAREGRAAVLEAHTFDHRAVQLVEALARHDLPRIAR